MLAPRVHSFPPTGFVSVPAAASFQSVCSKNNYLALAVILFEFPSLIDPISFLFIHSVNTLAHWNAICVQVQLQ